MIVLAFVLYEFWEKCDSMCWKGMDRQIKWQDLPSAESEQMCNEKPVEKTIGMSPVLNKSIVPFTE